MKSDESNIESNEKSEREISSHVTEHRNHSKDNDIMLYKTNLDIKFDNYNSERYIYDVNKYGLENLWAHILDYTVNNGTNEFLNPNNFGAMYEAGLAEQDKKNKKKSGQYYTPKDVSLLMAQWLKKLEGSNVCDVGCGTGNLILAYLEIIGKKEVISLLKNRKIFLYDFDKIALTIAKYSIALLYGIEFLDTINAIYCDFLSNDVQLPDNAKIITNPPYAKIESVGFDWKNSKVQQNTKELYAAFMEKIIDSKNQAVIISPYSFLGGNKFFELRKLMSLTNGFIFAFDNVPGNIFNGRKHGIFNTNTANSVRAAITVIENQVKIRGFRTTHLIRFKNDEREKLLDSSELEKLLSSTYQSIENDSEMFARCHVELEDCFHNWIEKSSQSVKDILSNIEDTYTFYMPNTCRYFTTASKKKLKRGGYLTISVKDENMFNYLYSLVNSSFAYWWWRVFDGGITYPVSLFKSIPIFYDLLNENDKRFFSDIVKEMILHEDKYTITKLNAGNIQENIKFPKLYRDKINQRFITILSCNLDASLFDIVHKNSHYGDLAGLDDDE